MQSWQNCKKILCIRPDNMGDLLMTTPALRAVKHTFNAQLTMLTSGMAAGIAKWIPEIDEVITFDAPWVKTNALGNEQAVLDMVARLKQEQFDAAIIFTVYSQNPMPTIMLAYLAGIPLRLAYCRENPYQLLTHWVPDEEPYTFIKHQVRRDLDLVAVIGATTPNESLSLNIPDECWPQVEQKLHNNGIDLQKPWLIMHPGVSEPKREYPVHLWAQTARQVVEQMEYQILLTGSGAERELAKSIQAQAGNKVFDVAGLFNLEEFVTLISHALVVVSVNTGTIHIAAAVHTPVVVLYALTNPQHTPWKVANRILPFNVPVEAQSKNEVIRHVNRYFNQAPVAMPCAEDVVTAINELLNTKDFNAVAESEIINIDIKKREQQP